MAKRWQSSLVDRAYSGQKQYQRKLLLWWGKRRRSGPRLTYLFKKPQLRRGKTTLTPESWPRKSLCFAATKNALATVARFILSFLKMKNEFVVNVSASFCDWLKGCHIKKRNGPRPFQCWLMVDFNVDNLDLWRWLNSVFIFIDLLARLNFDLCARFGRCWWCLSIVAVLSGCHSKTDDGQVAKAVLITC